MGVDIIASREGEHDYVRERIYQFMYWFIIKQGNDPKSVPNYLSGIIGSLVECDREGRSSAASLFKEIADSQAIQGTLPRARCNATDSEGHSSQRVLDIGPLAKSYVHP